MSLGFQSLVDPRFNEGRERLPLWLLFYWQKINDAVHAQRLWSDCYVWLSTVSLDSEDTDFFAGVYERLMTLTWDMDVNCGRVRTTALEISRCLRNVWLSSKELDIMMAHIATKARTVIPTVIITTSFFVQSANSMLSQNDTNYKGSMSQAAQFLRSVQDLVREGHNVLYAPVNIQNCHWIALRIDFTKRTMEYGGYCCAS